MSNPEGINQYSGGGGMRDHLGGRRDPGESAARMLNRSGGVASGAAAKMKQISDRRQVAYGKNPNERTSARANRAASVLGRAHMATRNIAPGAYKAVVAPQTRPYNASEVAQLKTNARVKRGEGGRVI